MTTRRTGWEMMVDMTRRALAELEQTATPDDPHVAKARDILDDALYLAKITGVVAK